MRKGCPTSRRGGRLRSPSRPRFLAHWPRSLRARRTSRPGGDVEGVQPLHVVDGATTDFLDGRYDVQGAELVGGRSRCNRASLLVPPVSRLVVPPVAPLGSRCGQHVAGHSLTAIPVSVESDSSCCSPRPRGTAAPCRLGRREHPWAGRPGRQWHRTCDWGRPRAGCDPGNSSATHSQLPPRMCRDYRAEVRRVVPTEQRSLALSTRPRARQGSRRPPLHSGGPLRASGQTRYRPGSHRVL